MVISINTYLHNIIERELQTEIEELKLFSGYWYAKFPSQENKDPCWLLVSELLTNKRFQSKKQPEPPFDTHSALYLIE